MTPILLAILVSMLISTITLGIAIQKRDAPKSRYFILFTLFILVYTIGRAFEATASNLEASYLGVILGYLGSPYLPLTMLLFLLDYYDIKINKRPLLALYALPFLISILVAVPPLRKYYYLEYSFFPGPPVAQIMVTGSPLYYILVAANLIVLAICLALSLWGAIKFSKTERWPSWVVFISVLLPMLFELLYVLGLTPLGLDTTTIALGFSVGLLGVAVYRLNLLRVLPLAKDVILEQLSDAFIIVSLENRYLEANAAAIKRFPFLSDIPVGQKLDMADLFTGLTEDMDGRTLASILQDGTQHHYRLSETEIEQNGKKQCICYTFHDVTDTRKLMAELETMATYDSLTNIYNRATFYRLAARELECARTQKTPVCAFAIDIDHFKEVNDTYGHFFGDEIIKSIVNKIAGQLRSGDLFARVGGDEFNVLLPGTDAKSALALAKHIQTAVNAEPILCNAQRVPVTVSVGIAVFEMQRHTNLERLLMDVDSALYESKNTGRNKVCVYACAE